MTSTSSQPVTELLARWSNGDISARDALIPLVYDELRRIARRCLTSQSSSHTLQPTALVHEAYLRLARHDHVDWQGRAHFFAMAAQMMRQILVDHARRHSAGKRGARATMLSLDDVTASTNPPPADLLALDEALEKLAGVDPRKARAMELKFFGGLDMAEIAAVLNLSIKTVEKDVRMAGAWLHADLIPFAIAVAALAALAAVGVRHSILGRPMRTTSRVPFGFFFAPAIWLAWFAGVMLFASP